MRENFQLSLLEEQHHIAEIIGMHNKGAGEPSWNVPGTPLDCFTADDGAVVEIELAVAWQQMSSMSPILMQSCTLT